MSDTNDYKPRLEEYLLAKGVDTSVFDSPNCNEGYKKCKNLQPIYGENDICILFNVDLNGNSHVAVKCEECKAQTRKLKLKLKGRRLE